MSALDHELVPLNQFSVNNILFKHTDTYRIYMNNLHTQMYITVIRMGYRSKSVTFLNLFPVKIS